MKKILLFLFLLFSMKSLGQNPKLDSLKMVVKELSKQPVSVQRDSILTILIVGIRETIPRNDSDLVQFWTDSLSRFSKVSRWEQSIAYSHFVNASNYFYKGFASLAFKEFEFSVGLFKKFQNGELYATSSSNLITIITNFLIVKPLADDATEKKYLNYLLDGLALAEKQGNIENIANINLCLFQYYMRHKNYKESQRRAINAREVTKIDPVKYFYTYHAAKASEGLALLYLGRQEEGFILLNRVKNICEKPRKEGDGLDKYLLAGIEVYLGNYYIEKREYRNAIVEAKMGMDALKTMKIASYTYVLNKIFYQAYKNLENPKEALIYFEKVQAFDQDAQSKESQSQFMEWQLKYEDEKQKNQIQVLENQKLTQSRNVLLLVGLLALGVTGYVFWSNRKLKKKNVQIQEALLKGQTTERKRMASELHDNISNKILGVKMRVELLENEHFTEKEKINYQATLGFIDEVYEDVRLVSHNLLPEELETKGLGLALENLVKKLNLIGKTHFENSITTLQTRFPARLEYEIYNIILESVNNVLKHANAKNAMISIIQENNLLKVTVKDNGKGFDNQLVNFDSLGLKSIHSRIEALRGKVEILDNNGTQVLIEVPV
jgi:signal transduction histidine kinase